MGHGCRRSSADYARETRRLVELGSGQQERRVPRLGRGAGVPIKGDIGSALSDNDIFILNIDDCLAGACSALNITNDPLQIDDDPDWSPDGSRIAFTSHSVLDTGQDSETAEIWTMNPDGSGRMQLTFNNEEERAPPGRPMGRRSFTCVERSGSTAARTSSSVSWMPTAAICRS